MSYETLNFANHEVIQGDVQSIYEIGVDETHGGVAREMSAAFGHDLSEKPEAENLGELISKVGPAKDLQENIARVQEALGTNDDAVAITRGWAERSGLLIPVERSYLSSRQTDQNISLAVITGGVRNWMARRTSRLIELGQDKGVDQALLVAGNRSMKATEGPDVEDGMTEADYMEFIVADQLKLSGITTLVIRAATGIGDEVMLEGAKATNKLIDTKKDNVAVVSNAGAWVQNVGQFRRALIEIAGGNFDQKGQQITAVSDSFELGTGVEPTSTHQNPFTAAGQIARNLQERVRHYR